MIISNISKNGIGVSKGYAIGTAYVIKNDSNTHTQRTTNSAAKETERLKAAIELSKEQIHRIACKAAENLDKKHANIIESQINFLDDPAFIGEAFSLINSKAISAETAISNVMNALYDSFLQLDNEYIKERAADIKDVGERILRNLSGECSNIDFNAMPQNTVLFAHNLTPSDTVQIDKEKVSAFVTETGGKTSHMAILAKTLGIAAITGCAGILDAVENGAKVIVDGVYGKVIINPDEKTINKYSVLSEKFNRQKAENMKMAQKPIYTKDGKHIVVAANIGNLQDLKTAIHYGAEGVGLFRTEFLYMNRNKLPSEEEQFVVYKKAAQMLAGKPLTIRTLDIGGDKDLPYLKFSKESNPFLGLRAIRLCLKHPEIFKVQLKAILRASAFGNIKIMFPMISNMNELTQAKKIMNECKQELRGRGEKISDDIKIGIMIEIPSAAIMADVFASEADFFSIGTNDLTQYTLAADRMNENITELYDPLHPAVLRLIKMTITASQKASIPCSMCGELASDERAIPELLKYGLDEFSVNPGAIPDTKSNLLRAIQHNHGN
ncbi:MAG: Phosphoenolpyruvate-protein phosphotransferase [Oscillospiraceae bacterium]|jgi:phosphoenolpyruvate-protein phosphotransferase (PTS system enzyme I)